MDEYALPLQTPCVYHDPNFLSDDEATDCYKILLKNTKWEKSPKINRWVSLMELPKQTNDADEESLIENEGRGYRYRDAPGAAVIGFPPTVHKLKTLAEKWYNSKTGGEPVEFNVCLLNYYQDGQQRIGWHSDREEVGRTTPIASLSLGATRQFLIRSKTDGVRDRCSIDMTNGSIVVMENECQLKYLHSVPRESDVREGRINLTFRCKREDETTSGEIEHEKRDHWVQQISSDLGEGELDSKAGAWKAEHDGVALVIGSGGLDKGQVYGDDVVFYDSAVNSEPSIVKGIEYCVKTNIGAECYAAAEIAEVIDVERYEVIARPFGIAGYVACCEIQEDTGTKQSNLEELEDSKSRMEGTLLQLRTAHHVLKYHDHFDLNEVVKRENAHSKSKENKEKSDDALSNIRAITGEMLYSYFKEKLMNKESSISTLSNLSAGGTFRVSCERTGGQHKFQAPEVEREVGGAMSEYYHHIKPKMSNFDINIRVDVIASKVLIGTQINVDDLSKDRHFLRFRNAVTIKTNLAYSMIRCANIKNGDLVVDPFCGSGTILLEALDYYQKKIKCVGMDVSRRSANGARENAIAEGFGEDVCQFHCCDARNFRKHLEEGSVSAIVTNMPWGIMTGNKNVSDLQSMYEVFLRTAWYILKDRARIVMLVLRGLQLTRIVRKLSGRYRLLSVNVVRTTNNLPSIVVIEKLAVDEVRDSVKHQLAYLSQFVNVSSEMYSAVHYEKIDETTL
mmetsp:Transcript_23002/g.46540  ORF Transcript_23002/g.46540 Transcript_23002/m.46540 type:complete len:735 (+) Transcript_23002:83-2287(+)